MSSVHVLDGDGHSYRVVAHFAMPAGNNSAGVAWKAAALAAGLTGTTVLPTGNGPGQIDSAELAQVQAGDVAEIVVSVLPESGGTNNATRQATVSAQIAVAVADAQADWQRRLRYYGMEIA